MFLEEGPRILNSLSSLSYIYGRRAPMYVREFSIVLFRILAICDQDLPCTPFQDSSKSALIKRKELPLISLI